MKKTSKKTAHKAKKEVKKAATTTATKLVKPSTKNNALVAESPKTNGIDDWTVRDAARTIAQAEEHKKNPKLMKAVKEHVKSLASAVGGIK